MAAAADLTATVAVPPVALGPTLASLRRSGWDPTCRLVADGFWRATRTAVGPATLHVQVPAGVVTEVVVAAWGPGAGAAVSAVAALAGAHDRPDAFVAHHELTARLVRRHPGRRLPAGASVVDTAVPTVLEQKVTGLEAGRSYRWLARRFGGRAPGPADLMLPPHPQRLAEVGYADLHPGGLERRRAQTILAVCRRADRLEALVGVDAVTARQVLEAVPGLGPWSSAMITLRSHGDPDAVIVGDAHLPHLVVHALTGRRRGSDAEMLELLAPYRGQRARAQALLAGAGRMRRRAPRPAPRRFASS